MIRVFQTFFICTLILKYLNKYMPSNKPSDLELLQNLLSNDQHAFNELFERHWSKVYAVSFRYVRDEEAALEITHDIFLNIWNKRHQLNISSFKSYVLTSASYHGIRKSQNLKATRLQYIEDYACYGEFIPSKHLTENNTGEHKIEVEELNGMVNSLLEHLPKRCREIYLLSRNENLSITEISLKLNISKRTVENQLTIALKHLRKLLNYSALFIFFQGFHK